MEAERRGTEADLAKSAAGIAIPTALTLAGTLGGPAAAAALGARAPGAVAGVTTALEAAGGLVGEGINQLTGLTEPSKAALVATGIAPMAGRLVGEGLRRAIPMLPGAQAGRRELATRYAEDLPDMLRASMTGDPKSLYALAEAANANSFVADLLPRTRAKVTELLSGPKGEFRLSKYAQSAPIREQSRVFLGRQAGEPAGPEAGRVAVAPLQEEYSRLGERASSQALMGREKGALRQLYRAITQDLEAAAPANPGIATLLDANKNYRLEMTAQDLGDIIQAKIASKEGGLSIQANADAIINTLERPRTAAHKALVDELVTLGHYDNVLAGIKKAGKMGGTLSVGQQGEFFRRHVGLALVGSIPAYITGSAVPAAAVYGAGLATARLMGTGPGKRLVQGALERVPLSGRVAPNVAQALGQGTIKFLQESKAPMRGRVGQPPVSPTPTDQPTMFTEPGELRMGKDGWLE